MPTHCWFPLQKSKWANWNFTFVMKGMLESWEKMHSKVRKKWEKEKAENAADRCRIWETESERGCRRVRTAGVQMNRDSEKELWLLRWKNADVWRSRGDQKCQKEVGGEKAREGQKGISVLLPYKLPLTFQLSEGSLTRFSSETTEMFLLISRRG